MGPVHADHRGGSRTTSASSTTARPERQGSETLAAHDLFLLPTLGENFGHVFLEAFLAGLPVITSDRTPWRELTAKRVGFDLPLEQPDAFQAAIQQFVDMDDAQYRQWSESARRYGRQVAADRASWRRTASCL